MSGQAAPLYGLLLSGGASLRMGRDKAHLAWHGEAQLLRAWRMLDDVTERCFLSARDDQSDDPLRAGLPLIADSRASVGPAAGILSAQDVHPEAAWLVLACDLPLLDLATLRDLVARRDIAADATAFNSRHDGLPEPLCAIWEPSSRAVLLERFEAGRHCPRKALLCSRTTLLAPPGRALDNCNTPDELAEIRSEMEVQA